MTHGPLTIIHPVRDLEAAKKVYAALLGTEPYVDEPYYVGFSAADHEVGLDPNGHRKDMNAPLVYWHVDDINATLKGLLAAGATEKDAVHDVGGGRLIGSVTDPDGNVIGLLQPE